jgi:phosphoadenosine phosphosulfate reductase
VVERNCVFCGTSNKVFRFRDVDICVNCFLKSFGTRVSWSSEVFAGVLEGKKVFALFSGGKDSLCALVYTKEVIERYGVRCELTAVHINTDISIPGLVDYIRTVCQQLGVELVILRPEKSFEEFVKEHGLPSPRRRWCCEHLKMRPLWLYITKVEGEKVLVDGVRGEESTRRLFGRAVITWFDKLYRFPCPTVSPIFYWSNKEVESFIRSRGLPINPVYSILNSSGECVCGAFATKTMFLKIKKYYPELFQRLVSIERMNKSGWTFLYKNRRRIPLSEL